MNKKLLITRWLAVALCLVVSLTASAYDFMVNGIAYNKNSDGKSVTVTYEQSPEYGNPSYRNARGSLTIPSTVSHSGKTYSVTSIGGAAFCGCSGFTGSLTIPNSVTAIGGSAFKGCSGFTGSLTIPNSVTAIGGQAFSGCSGFTGSLTIGNSVTEIGEGVFSGCSGLTSVTIPNSVTEIGNEAFSGCSGLRSVHITDLVAWCKIKFGYDYAEFNSQANPLYYAHHLFLNGNEVKDLSIPNYITAIGDYAFYGCSGLTSVTIPNSVTSIGYNAFDGCSGLTSVTIGNSVAYIGDGAFWGCSGLTSVTIPNLVIVIGDHAFCGCSDLTSVTIGNSVTYIGESAFWGCSGLTSVTIPNSVTYIGNAAFSGCSGLTSVHITDLAAWCRIKFGDEYYEESKYQCNPLCYAHHLFLNGNEVKDLVIPNSVTSVGDYAFWGCSGLMSVTIPNSVTEIGNEAFCGCSGLTSVSIDDLAAWCKINFSDNNSNPLYYAHRLFLNGIEVNDLVIPNSVTSVGDYAFWGCSGLTSVDIPNSVKSIGSGTFSGCTSLSTVHSHIVSPTIVTYGSQYSKPFSNLPSNRVLYVTAGLVDSYKACTSTWAKDFPVISEGDWLGGIRLNRTEMELNAGAAKTLTVMYIPDNPTDADSLTWSTSNASVATVSDNGVVRGVGSGVCTITATATNNDGDTFTASCIVTVENALAASITFDYDELELALGESATLTATVLPATAPQGVEWASTKPAVATVDQNGHVNAVGEGLALIKATTTDGSNLTATCIVTVNRRLATSISVSPTSATLQVGVTQQLTATVLPSGVSQSVTWTSSNTSVATVSSTGLVTAKSPGTATIRATTTDGSNLSASCVVTVSRPLATSLTLDPSELQIGVDESTQIDAILSPDIALKTLQWSSSNTNVATVNQDGIVTGVGEGYAVIIANTVDGSNLTATCLVNVVNNRVRGDVNHDGVVDIFDVNLVINLITHMIPDDTYSRLADIDGNGAIDIFDLNIIINIMLELDTEPIAPNTYSVNGVAFRMVKVEGGTFTMGATLEQGSDAKATEKPAHQVTLSDYAIGETEVTQALWQAVMGSNPSANASSAALPVETVSWNDCQTFIARLNQLTGLTFRLPTEAEWEYAARGGSLSRGTKYAGSNDLDEVAWWKENSGIQTHPVGQKKPNELGLYDMSGNVYELVADWYGAYTSAAQTNPTGPVTGTMRVSRGGGCNRDQIGQRVSFRGTTSPTTADFVMGLRLAM